ncbi:MAG TPA: hypothetical protein VGJ20_37720 [Xanthobacteraceae bacterium]|jgi:hypothetical protein
MTIAQLQTLTAHFHGMAVYFVDKGEMEHAAKSQAVVRYLHGEMAKKLEALQRPRPRNPYESRTIAEAYAPFFSCILS